MSNTTLFANPGERITREDLKLLPAPEATETHHPVAFHVLDDITQHRIQKEFGQDICIEPEYALNKHATQFFAVYGIRGLEETNSGTYPAVALRSSIDKTLQPKVAGGAKVMACTNTMVWGSLLEVCRKQTANSMGDIEMMIVRIMTQLESHYSQAELEVDLFKEIEVFDQEGYAILGQLYGGGVVTANQLTRSFSAWKKPQYEEFQPRTAWSLYNSVTEGLKKGQPGHMMGKYMRLHQDFQRRFMNTWHDEGRIRSHDDDFN